jgi:hypothetical protein
VLYVKTTCVVGKQILLQIEIFGKSYRQVGQTFSQAAFKFLENFFLDYSNYSLFQGTKIMANNDAAIIAQMVSLADAKGALSINKNANYKLSTLTQVVDDPKVKQIIEETIDEMGHRDIYDLYHRTDEVKDAALHAEGLLIHFSEEGNKPYCLDSDDVLDMILDAWAHEVPFDGCESAVSSMDPITLAKIQVGNTSAGNFSAVPVKKKLCAIEVAGVVAHQAQIGRAKTAPSKPAQKLEVIKKVSSTGKPKKVRAIQVDSADNALAAEAILGTFVRQSRGVEGGSAIGVPTNRGFATRVVRHLSRPLSGRMRVAEDLAVERGLHESDMTAWEATAKPETAMAYVILAISALGSLAMSGAVAANLFATYYHPFFSISGEQVCSRPGVVSSGSKPTADGNTKRHRFMLLTFKLYVKRHGMRLGIKGCKCVKCELMRDVPDFGKHLAYVELALLLQAILMGDDFLCVWNDASAFYDRFCDKIFGTVHKTERKGFGEGAFLKRRLRKTAGGWWTTYVPEQDVIPKFKGPGMITADNKMCSCINAAVNSNNRVVYDFAKALYTKLDKTYGRTMAVDEALLREYKGTYECVGFPSWSMCEANHLPTPWDLMAAKANQDSVMATNLPSRDTMALTEQTA